jgi:NAD(P)-dependent dehydrogenase (short-subunit alcohol dehydrogenase family)
MIQTSSETQLVELLASAGGGLYSIKGEVTDVLGEKVPALWVHFVEPVDAEITSTVVDLAFARKLAPADLTPDQKEAALSTHVLEAGAAAPPAYVLLHVVDPHKVVIQFCSPALRERSKDFCGVFATGGSLEEATGSLREMLKDVPPVSAEEPCDKLLGLLPLLRGLLARPTGQDIPYDYVVVRAISSPEVMRFLASENAKELAESMPLYPAHVFDLGNQPLWVEISDPDAPAQVKEQVAAAVSAYAEQHEGMMPKVLLLPGLGVVCAGTDARQANRASFLTRLTLAALRPFDVDLHKEYYPRFQPDAGLPLQGHVAVVTGAAGAIGAGICRGLLLQGAHVAVTDLPGERMDALVAELKEIDVSRVIGVPLDVTDPDSVDQGVAQIVETWGGIDIAVINAGVAHVSPLAEMDLEVFRRLERINVEGALLLLRAMGRHFKLQGTGGDIVMVSTKNVFAPGATFGAYSATKAAAHQLARIASLEMAEMGVRVNMVAPDAVFSDHGTRKSGLWQEVGPSRMKARGLDEAGLEEYYRSRNLLKARITPDHVANAVLFFVTRQTPTTGATIPVDGGLPDAVPR